MRVSTSMLFNTSNSKEAKNTKSTLNTKGVDNPLLKTLETSQIVQEAKTKSIGDFIYSLMKSIAKDETVKKAVVETLKNSQIEKNIQNSGDILKDIAKAIKSESALLKYLPKLEKFLVDVKSLDGKTLQAQLQNSGVFTEAKLTHSETFSKVLPQELKNLLQNIEKEIKKLPSFQISKQEISSMIKDFISGVDKTKSLQSDFIKEIKNMLSFVEKNNFKLDAASVKKFSKMQYVFEMNSQDKLFNKTESLKNALIDSTNKQIILQKIETSLGSIKSITQLPLENISYKSIRESKLEVTPIEATSKKESIVDIKTINSAFLNEVKKFVEILKSLPDLKKPIVQTVSKLESLIKEVSLQESKIQNQTPIEPKEVQKLENEVRKALGELKIVINEPKLLQLNIPSKNIDTITKLIDTLLQQTKIFLTEPKLIQEEVKFQPRIEQSLQQQPQMVVDTASKILKIVELIKFEIKALDIKQSHNMELLKNVQTLEKLVKKELVDAKINPSFRLNQEGLTLKTALANDMKTVLLQVKEDIMQSATTPKQKELLIQVDKAINQMEYYQLNSHVTNSTNSYLPFLWQGLEKGEISFKKLKENRFFCEINLELKEYGKIDLMVMLDKDININMSVFAEKKEFVEVFEKNINDLKVGLNKLGLVPVNIQTFDALKDEKVKKQTYKFVGTQQIDMGVNIKV